MRRAHFLLGQEPGEKSGTYPHSAVLLAEGLKDLGWEISSDVAGWLVDVGREPLFPGGGALAADSANLIIFGDDYFQIQGSDRLPEAVSSAKVTKIFLEKSDLIPTANWIDGASFRRLDMIFKCHCNAYFRYPGNVRPTVFGISHRIAAACLPSESVERKAAVWDFSQQRYQHSVRIMAQNNVRPLIASRFEMSSRRNALEEPDSSFGQMMRRQTSGRHFTSYYERLKRSLLCACFGGWFLIPCRQKEAGTFCLWTRKVLRRLPVVTSMVAQWDSWRLWEAFAAGAAVLHVDFNRYQFLTGGPLPEPMKHYIPVDIRNPAKSLLPLLDEPSELLRIGEAGRRWAMENYTSKPMAARVLTSLGLG